MLPLQLLLAESFVERIAKTKFRPAFGPVVKITIDIRANPMLCRTLSSIRAVNGGVRLKRLPELAEGMTNTKG